MIPLPKEGDIDAWFARLDVLGAHEFLPEGAPDDPPSLPDEQLSTEFAATPWDAIDALGDSPFMPEGRDQGAALDDKPIFEP